VVGVLVHKQLEGGDGGLRGMVATTAAAASKDVFLADQLAPNLPKKKRGNSFHPFGKHSLSTKPDYFSA